MKRAEEIKEEIKIILEGIDKDECSHGEGWWETSDGAEFGKNKLNEILELIDKECVLFIGKT